ncbi:hypothetical protein RDWZM_003373 [Blomia tropicalis]|uniref:Uncharacterized protein n=1 Tax=Blomia tropicalis TaxID=40697 RepID=A0A9Q0RQT1_BLOTA|nr:hypothetical protein RDWZM_003373 [Blomia tropicalis]
MSLLEETTREINSLFKNYIDLVAVLICDCEGASVLKLISDNHVNNLQQGNFMMQKLISCSENVCKLELGECKRIVSQFDDYQMVTFFKDRLVVTLIGNNQIETGTLISLESEFKTICDTIQAEIKGI